MKIYKKIATVLSLSLLILSAHGFGLGENDSPGTPAYNYLYNIAKTKGMIRVIVKMDVPAIDELTARSNSYKTGEADLSALQRAIDADLALEEAISVTAYNVLHRLNGEFYTVNRTYSTLPYLALNLSPEALSKLGTLPEVLDILEDRARPLPKFLKSQEEDTPPREPQLDQSRRIIGADVAWGMGFTGKGWYVAILDTGILKTHEMFQGKKIVERCYAIGDWFSSQGHCPNGKKEMAGAGSAVHHDAIYYGFDHGTHVTGIAAGNNGVDHFGVAKNADVIAVQVFSHFPASECDGEPCVLSYDSDQVKGLEFVYSLRSRYKIASANMSLGAGEYAGPCDQEAHKPAIDNLKAVGIAVAVATGNEGYCNGISSPACISSAIAVGGTDKSDKEYTWGNWHPVLVDVMAPGVSIRSAAADHDSNYQNWSGTSMAAPHVAGAMALLREFSDDMTVDELLDALKETGTLITTKCGTGKRKPRIDVGETIFSLLEIVPPVNIAGDQQKNSSFLQTEYINILTWEANPLNEGKNITKYRIYVVPAESQLVLLQEVDSATFTYRHRKVERLKTTTYALTAVDDKGEESLPRYYTLDLGYVQGDG